jgi:hypothetical protein
MWVQGSCRAKARRSGATTWSGPPTRRLWRGKVLPAGPIKPNPTKSHQIKPNQGKSNQKMSFKCSVSSELSLVDQRESALNFIMQTQLAAREDARPTSNGLVMVCGGKESRRTSRVVIDCVNVEAPAGRSPALRENQGESSLLKVNKGSNVTKICEPKVGGSFKPTWKSALQTKIVLNPTAKHEDDDEEEDESDSPIQAGSNRIKVNQGAFLRQVQLP